MSRSATSGFRLVVRTGHAAGRSIEVPPEGLIIGREADGPGRLESDFEVSRQHARFRRTHQGALLVEDLGSRNGTYVNGERVEGPALVLPGDVVTIGGTELALHVSAGAPDVTARVAASYGGVGIGGNVVAREGSIGALGTVQGNVDLSRHSQHDHSGLWFISRIRGLPRFLIFVGLFASMAGIGLFGYPIVRALSTSFDSGDSCFGKSGDAFVECVQKGPSAHEGPDLTPWVPLGLGIAFAGMLTAVAGFALARSD